MLARVQIADVGRPAKVGDCEPAVHADLWRASARRGGVGTAVRSTPSAGPCVASASRRARASVTELCRSTPGTMILPRRAPARSPRCTSRARRHADRRDPPPSLMSRPPAASWRARARFRMPPVTKWNVVLPSIASGARAWWVRTNTDVVADCLPPTFQASSATAPQRPEHVAAGIQAPMLASRGLRIVVDMCRRRCQHLLKRARCDPPREPVRRRRAGLGLWAYGAVAVNDIEKQCTRIWSSLRQH